ncbi:hypothetical protein ISF6_0938 [Piscinibacter sakaiensis]|uniref:Uncharacterized protein n=1 Tax=Piscinibacter sakaiensis TaxID=1547922 RepID=A0A0K8NZI6_PISS1|nr:hypothetical protein ISF6_0938 [Piscinibacter sakaiensis]
MRATAPPRAGLTSRRPAPTIRAFRRCRPGSAFRPIHATGGASWISSSWPLPPWIASSVAPSCARVEPHGLKPPPVSGG